jgi:DNA repair photolyase
VRQIQNPPNPFEGVEREWLDEPPDVHLEVYEEQAHSILSENDSPDLPFRWSVNPYRGCFHACAYCYARPTHEYLGFGAGTDFESRIVVKSNAAELLRRAFDNRSWSGELIMFSGNTDCYQPLEANWRMTRACLEVCAEYRNPVGVITRSLLVQRDVDVLQRLHAEAEVHVFFSIPFADDALARAIEPQAPLVSRRFEAMRRVAAAGIPTGVSVAPIIPGLNDDDIAPVLERAWDAGARYASHILLRLPGSVRSVFLERLRAALPDRAQRVENRIRETRGGALSDARFGERMRGHGVYWDMIEQQWDIHTRRIGFTRARSGERATHANTFRRPGAASPQGVLFADGGDS